MSMYEPSQLIALLKSMENLGVSRSLLRDWFAGQILGNIQTHAVSSEEAARFSYQYADAMMKERENGRNGP